MSEEQVQETNDGTWSGLKKTIVGTLGTVVAGGGVWLSTLIFGGHDEKAAETPAQAQPTIVINNSQQQAAPAAQSTKVIERVVEKPAAKTEEAPKPKKPFQEEPKW
jgi:hypothetical protein